MEKFIITKDAEVAAKLLASGFIKASENAGVWTFVNQAPKGFSFAEINGKFAFSNVLSM